MRKLFDVASDGSVKEWQISVEGSTIVTAHGKRGGKVTVTRKEITSGKNVGRSNETTSEQQAISEAESTYRKKLDKGYVTDLDFAQSKDAELLPMLAHSFDKRFHDIIYPAYIQPKLNGVRLLAKKVSESKISYTSRGGKPFNTLSHFTETLLGLMVVGQVFDGEVYNHDWSFQRIVSAVKKPSQDSKALEFWVYDMIPAHKSMIYSSRHMLLTGTFNRPTQQVRLCPTERLLCPEQIRRAHNSYVELGFEGLIIRNSAGVYTLKHRSKDLQKFKTFIDEEFLITGGKEGTGNDAGCIIFEVKTETGKRFNARPRGSVEFRRALFDDLPNLIGKQLTVRYQELSEDGVPIFPVGITVRDYE
jgi:ATP-dependent DNA ligase